LQPPAWYLKTAVNSVTSGILKASAASISKGS
jgi:hypothetical protein